MRPERAVLVLALALVTPARAEVARCRTALLAGATRHAAAVARALRACVAGGAPVATCAQDGNVAQARAAAGARLARDVARGCCGRDRTCGTADDERLDALGWSVPACPGFEDAACDAPIAGVADVGVCLRCVGEAAALRAVGLGAADAPADGDGPACRRTLATTAARLFVARARGLAACVRRGGDAHACAARAVAGPPARAVCRACGGADHRCGGADDVDPDRVGLPASCPGVAGCGGSLGDAGALAVCAACVASYAAGCVDALAAAEPDAACHPVFAACRTGIECAGAADCPPDYACADNGVGTRYCVGPPCATDAGCRDGAVCAQVCTRDGCGARRCQCPGFRCHGPAELCLGTDALACHKLCTQDSDCVAPFGDVCVNSGHFQAGLCVGTAPCN